MATKCRTRTTVSTVLLAITGYVDRGGEMNPSGGAPKVYPDGYPDGAGNLKSQEKLLLTN
jgi:hypothetical protein